MHSSLAPPSCRRIVTRVSRVGLGSASPTDRELGFAAWGSEGKPQYFRHVRWVFAVRDGLPDLAGATSRLGSSTPAPPSGGTPLAFRAVPTEAPLQSPSKRDKGSFSLS